MKNSHKHFLPRYFHSVCFSLSLGKFKSLKCIPLMICDSKSILWSHDWWSLIPAIGGVLIAINFNWLTSSFLILLFKTYIFLEHFFHLINIYFWENMRSYFFSFLRGSKKHTHTQFSSQNKTCIRFSDFVPTCCSSSTVLVATNLRRSDLALLAFLMYDDRSIQSQ